MATGKKVTLEVTKKAINDFNGDTSRSKQSRLDGLQELRDELDVMGEVLESEMEEDERAEEEDDEDGADALFFVILVLVAVVSCRDLYKYHRR